MKLEQLQTLYNLIAKYEKKDWIFKKGTTLLGYPISITYQIDNYLRYGYVDVSIDEIQYNKATGKFVTELERTTGCDIHDFDLVIEAKDEVYDEVEAEFEAYNRSKLSAELRTYIIDVFYTNGKLNTWKTVSKNYNPDQKNASTTIRISSDYNAVITKGQPVAVGCQRINIDIIRKIVEAYDAL